MDVIGWSATTAHLVQQAPTHLKTRFALCWIGNAKTHCTSMNDQCPTRALVHLFSVWGNPRKLKPRERTGATITTKPIPRHVQHRRTQHTSRHKHLIQPIDEVDHVVALSSPSSPRRSSAPRHAGAQNHSQTLLPPRHNPPNTVFKYRNHQRTTCFKPHLKPGGMLPAVPTLPAVKPHTTTRCWLYSIHQTNKPFSITRRDRFTTKYTNGFQDLWGQEYDILNSSTEKVGPRT